MQSSLHGLAFVNVVQVREELLQRRLQIQVLTPCRSEAPSPTVPQEQLVEELNSFIYAPAATAARHLRRRTVDDDANSSDDEADDTSGSAPVTAQAASARQAPYRHCARDHHLITAPSQAHRCQ